MGVILEQHRDRLSKVRQFERANILAIYEDLSFCWVVNSYQEFQYGTFSRAIWTNDDLYTDLT